MPQDGGLTSCTLSIGAGGAAPAPGAAAGAAPLGTLTVSATGLSHDSTAHWITRMRELGILSDLWVPSSTKGGGQGGGESVTFSSNANITQQAKSARSDLFKASELCKPS